jgi:ABC-type Fe3+-hydroxamate transport system substrate-binding protein
MTALRSLLLVLCLALSGTGLMAASASEAPAAGAPGAKSAAAERIAVIDWGLAETLLGIGVTPLAVADLDNYWRWVSEPVMPDSVHDLGLRNEPNLELLAQLDPALILITPQFEGLRDKLEQIAPVKSLSIYRPESAALIAELDAQQAALRQRLGHQPQPPLLLVSFIDDRHVRVSGGSSLFSAVLERLGLTNAWAGTDNYWGYAQVGLEQLASQPDATLIKLLPMPLDAERALQRSVLWQAMPFVRAGRVHAFAPTWQYGGLLSAQRFARLLEEALLDE